VPREAGAALLTDSYDFSDLERHAAGERDAPPLDATAPIPLDLSDWGDAAAPRGEDHTVAGDTDDATDAQARRNASSS
jgi:hypothetical protein